MLAVTYLFLIPISFEPNVKMNGIRDEISIPILHYRLPNKTFIFLLIMKLPLFANLSNIFSNI